MKRSNILRIGRGCINEVYEILKSNNITGKILYVSDEVVDKLYGNVVKEQIEKVGILKKEFISENTISYAMTIAERVIATDVDCIVGIGGGRVLDVCKYAAYISKKPMMSIATTLANDGIASPIAVLKRKDNKPKSLGCTSPAFLIIDIDIIMNGPKQLIKAGIGDTISNYTALLDWDFACSKNKDEMNGYAYMMSRTSLDALMKTQYDSISPEFLIVLANSLVLSGIAMDYAGSSRPVSGSEHLFSHALDYYSDTKNLHGIQVALGTVSILKLLGRDFSDVLNYLRKFDVCINPARLGIDEDTFVNCMKNAEGMRNNRYTYLNEMDLSDERLRNAYRELVEEL